MDSYIKTGNVFLQPHKTGKKWKPVLLSLFPPSSSGVGRLEIQDVGGGDHGGGVRRHQHQPHVEKKLKVLKLSELINVLRLPPNAEACPMENMSAFCVEATARTLVFAAVKDDCVDWVEKLCQSMFQRSGVEGGGDGGGVSNKALMEENEIYASAEEASEFWVAVQRTDAAARCGINGSYWLHVGRETLQLKDVQTKNVIREWPYELLRRYGKDKASLTIEAGRRCDSGPGTFTFETQQAEKIFRMIQDTIRRKTITPANQKREVERVSVTNPQAQSPRPRTPDVTSVAALLERELTTDKTKREDLVAAAQPAHITLMPLPSLPTQDAASGGLHGVHSEPVYDDPADCVQPVPKINTSTALYVDPACILPLKPPKQTTAPLCQSSETEPCFDIHNPDSGYSEVFDKISPVQRKKADFQRDHHAKCIADDETIYAEPVVEKGCRTNQPKPDPFAHLYAQVCKKSPTSDPSSSGAGNSAQSVSAPSVTANRNPQKAKDQSFEDVIYENLGII